MVFAIAQMALFVYEGRAVFDEQYKKGIFVAYEQQWSGFWKKNLRLSRAPTFNAADMCYSNHQYRMDDDCETFGAIHTNTHVLLVCDAHTVRGVWCVYVTNDLSPSFCDPSNRTSEWSMILESFAWK